MIALALLLTGLGGRLPVQDKIDQIDRTFVCPESLPSDEAREDALKLFIAHVRAVEPNQTTESLIEYRQNLLVSHRGAVTLANERKRHGQKPR